MCSWTHGWCSSGPTLWPISELDCAVSKRNGVVDASLPSLKKCNATTMFEDNQANLEQAVEDLSGMLESPINAQTIPELRENITNKTAFVQKRSDIIMQDTLAGHWEVSRAEVDQSELADSTLRPTNRVAGSSRSSGQTYTHNVHSRFGTRTIAVAYSYRIFRRAVRRPRLQHVVLFTMSRRRPRCSSPRNASWGTGRPAVSLQHQHALACEAWTITDNGVLAS